ncbi:conserved membrane hypothetical protein [Gammaproteobacteria bacterium]
MSTESAPLLTKRYFTLLLIGGGLLLFLVGWILAVLGYELLPPPPPWGDEVQHRLDSMNQALSLVSAPWVVTVVSVHDDPYFLLHIAQQTLTLIWLWTIGILGYWWLQNPVRVWQIRRRGGHIVLWGTGRIGQILLQDQVRHGTPVILIGQPPLHPWMRPGVGVIASHKDGAQVWDTAGLAHAKALITVADDDQESLQASLEAARFLQEKHSVGNIPLIVHLGNDALRLRFERDLGLHSPQVKQSVRLFSFANLSARLLFKDSPPDKFRRLNNPACNHILILGAGDWGREIAFFFLCLAHFRHGGIPKVTFIDRSVYSEMTFFARYPQARLVGEVTFHRMDVHGEFGMTQLIKETILTDPPIGIYVCIGNAAYSMGAAILTERILRKLVQFVPPIYVHMDQSGLFQSMLNTDPEDLQAGGMIRPFGSPAAIFTSEMLLSEELDQVAQFLHESWFEKRMAEGKLQGSKPSLAPWKELPEYFKGSNRMDADHLAIKLRDLHCQSVPGLSPDKPTFTKQEVEEASRAEHQRWCAYTWLNDWKYAPIPDPSNRLSNYLVPYDELPQDVQEYDRQIVRDHLPAHMNDLGAPIRREWRVAVWAEGAGNAPLTVQQTASIQEFLSQRAPANTVPVLVIPLNQPSAWAVAQMALEMDIPLYLLLMEPTYDTLRYFCLDKQRRTILDLLGRAELLFVASNDQGKPDPSLGEAFLRTQGEALIGLGAVESFCTGFPEGCPQLILSQDPAMEG